MKGFSPLRDLPALGWLVAVIVVALTHFALPAPRWLMFHLLLLGAVTHSIMVWSQHFADTLLHTVATEARERLRKIRLILLNLGVIVVVAGIVVDRWHITALGAIAVGGAVLWHAVGLVLQLRSSVSLTTSARFAITVRFYVAAAILLPVGAVLGVMMAKGLAQDGHSRSIVAHVIVNLFGWVGLTIVGTLITLWPTILRTRVAEDSVTTPKRAFPLLLGAIGIALIGTLADLPRLTGAGLLIYVIGLALIIKPHLTEGRAKPPVHYPGWSVLAGMMWFVGSVATLAVAVLATGTWESAEEWLTRVTPALAAGFATQVLVGALSYLIPTSVGRGPAGARAANTALDRYSALRITVINLGLVLWLFPSPAPVRVALSIVVLLGLAAFIPLVFVAIRAARIARQDAARPDAGPRPRGPAAVSAVVSTQRHLGHVVTGLAAIALAVVIGVVVDPAVLTRGDAGAASAGITATGETTTVEVEARDMRFFPASVEVPAGNRLVIELTNTDKGDVHDLVLDSGVKTKRLAPGQSQTLDVGVVGRNIDGWCSVLGHRQMGMVFDVVVTGAPPTSAAPDGPDGTTAPGGTRGGMHGQMHGQMHGDSNAAPPSQPQEPAEIVAPEPGPAFTPYDPVLAPAPKGKVHTYTFTVTEQLMEVASGISQELWTFNGTAPGPVLRGKVGDTFEITLVNNGSMGHSIDFHAGENNWADVMRTIPPGESLVYTFTANRAGIWMYHCSTMPMTAHIANGMAGAVVIDPPDLTPVDHEYLMVQSEFYLGADGGPVDLDKLNAEKPDLVVFNGYANQYESHPLTAKVGERVRIWVLDVGPNRASSFHVVGGQFDTVWSEGDWRLRPGNRSKGGAQVLPLLPAQGGFVELEFIEPGTYPFVSHVMIDAERGAFGLFKVTD